MSIAEASSFRDSGFFQFPSVSEIVERIINLRLKILVSDKLERVPHPFNASTTRPSETNRRRCRRCRRRGSGYTTPASRVIKLIPLRINVRQLGSVMSKVLRTYGARARTIPSREGYRYYCSLRNPHCWLSAFNTLYCLFYNRNDALLSAPDKLHAALYL